MTDETPLPCPFCGGSAVVRVEETYGCIVMGHKIAGGWVVACANICAGNAPPGIGCEIGPLTLPHTSAAAAIKSWNIRGSRQT